MDAGTDPPVEAGQPEEAAVQDARTPTDADVGHADEDSGPDPDLDRRVNFQWPEKLPGKGTCHAGQYVGSFTCVVPPDPAIGEATPFELSGQVAFTLGTSSEQQVLSVIEGGLKDALGWVETARLAGSLRCVDKVFEARTGVGMLWIPYTDFQATLDGQFDDQSVVIEGDFLMTNAAGARCQGNFHVTAAP